MRWPHARSDKQPLKARLNAGLLPLTAFLKWVLSGLACGLLGGAVGAAFYYAVSGATALRLAHPWLVWLLPVGGIITALLYHTSRVNLSVNTVLLSVRSSKKVPLIMAPLIFVCTAITQLFGGSAGKEGAALQMGGAIGYQLARLMRFDDKDTHVLVMCGMSALFSAVFLTPLAAAMLAIEVISVGVFYFAALVPCLTASLTAYGVARLLGVQGVALPAFSVPELTVGPVLLMVVLGLLCAVVSMLLCIALHHTSFAAQRYIKNDCLRAAVGGAAVALLTFAVGNTLYNGTGMDLVVSALAGQTPPEAFALKLVFTALTIAAGLRGGEIVPTLAIGACLGCLFGSLVGLDPGFCAAVGLVALFCATINCPVSAMFLGLELFGSQAMAFFAVACCVAFALSGNYSLYTGQKLIYSKIKAVFTNADAHN